ncbi:MAG TPA: hypothetical protein DCS20_02570 [Candidatus Yonathbacteria bacterium]|nr:hypothetical protein [Candidatus Yonathbacteria bacterium]
MAHLYGGQSEYLISSERKNQQRINHYALVGLLLFVAVLIYTFVYRSGLLKFSILLIIVDIIAIIFFLPKLGLYGAVRDNFHNGHRAEGRAWYLLRRLSHQFHVFQDIKDINRLWGNIDFVVVGPTGVYTVEVKSHKGVIRFDGSDLTRNWRRFTEKNFLKQAKGQAYSINDFIKTKIVEDLWIKPLIVFTSSVAYVRVGTTEVSGVHVLHGNNFIQFIQNQRVILSDSEIKKIISAFCGAGFCIK